MTETKTETKEAKLVEVPTQYGFQIQIDGKAITEMELLLEIYNQNQLILKSLK
jgi:hypothetical protein